MSNKLYAIGIDIGGTKMSAILFDGEKTVADFTLATPQDNLNHFLIMADALIKPLEDEAKKRKIKIAGIGVGVPGVLAIKKERVVKCPNVPILDGVNLKEKMEEKFKMPVLLDNDTNRFVEAEAIFGFKRKYKNIFGMIIGTGIGGAWWNNGKIYSGAHEAAGEPGRMIVDFNDLMDLEEAYHKLMQNNPARMAQEAIKGDILAEKAYKELGEYLGLALANIVNLIDPEVIIIGGGVVESSELFLSETKKVMREHIMSAETKKIKIEKGKLGELAGSVGAAMLVSRNT